MFILTAETNHMSSANVYFVEFEQVNIYLRKFDV